MHVLCVICAPKNDITEAKLRKVFKNLNLSILFTTEKTRNFYIILELSQLWVYVIFFKVWHEYMYASKNFVIVLVDIGPFYIYMYIAI